VIDGDCPRLSGIFVSFVLALVNLARHAASPAIDVLEASGSPTDSLLDPAPRGAVTAPDVIVIRLAPRRSVLGSVVSQSTPATGPGHDRSGGATEAVATGARRQLSA